MQEYMDKMPGSPSNSLPSSRNNSIRAGVAFTGMDSSPSAMVGKGPVFARMMQEYGQTCFTGAVAKKYLTFAGIPEKDQTELWNNAALLLEHKDAVAAAVLQWAKEHEATMFTHAFQPLSAEGVRAGSTGQVHTPTPRSAHAHHGPVCFCCRRCCWYASPTAAAGMRLRRRCWCGSAALSANPHYAGRSALRQVHNAMFRPGKDGPYWCFTGEQLIQGETDGSSFQNGGLRATHTAGAYTVIDPSSPIYIRDDTVYIPTVLSAFSGEALDEKLPLLRSMAAIDREGRRLLKHLGHTSARRVFPNIGLEQVTWPPTIPTAHAHSHSPQPTAHRPTLC